MTGVIGHHFGSLFYGSASLLLTEARLLKSIKNNHTKFSNCMSLVFRDFTVTIQLFILFILSYCCLYWWWCLWSRTRSLAVGSGSMMCRVGSVVAPFCVYLTDVWVYLPQVYMFCLNSSLTRALFNILLPFFIIMPSLYPVSIYHIFSIKVPLQEN